MKKIKYIFYIIFILLLLFFFNTGKNFLLAVNYPQLPDQAKIGELENIVNNFIFSGCTVTLNQGDNLQNALNNAQPGDTICLTAGAVFNGVFTLPVKNNPQNKFINIVSTRLNELPAGKRVSPADKHKMAKITYNGIAKNYTIYAPPLANYYRFAGLEISNESGKNYSQVIQIGENSSAQDSYIKIPHHFIFDRVYIHGVPPVYSQTKLYNCNDAPSTSAGIRAEAAYVAVVNSHIDDIHDCDGDNYTFVSVNGAGVFLIENNFLHASGENIMIGGSDPMIQNLITSDIVVRGNHFYKDPKFASNDYVSIQNGYGKKNHFELKFGKRVLVQDNLFENQWESLNQYFSIVLKSVNQPTSGDSQNLIGSWAQVSDVTFQYNWLKNVSQAINLGIMCQGPAIPMKNILIRHNIVERLGDYVNQGDKHFVHIACPQNNNGLDNLIIENNTLVKPLRPIRYLASQNSNIPEPNNNFVMRNNILYGSFVIGGGLSTSSFNMDFPNPIISKNVLINSPSWNKSILPSDNFYINSYDNVGFIDYNNGNYQLSNNSPYKNAGTDGKDIGADFYVLNNNISKVLNGYYRYSGSISMPPSSPTPLPSTPPSPPPPSLPSPPPLSPPPSPPIVDLKINNQDGIITVPYGSSVNLSWVASNASSCIASGDWSGNKSVYGQEIFVINSNKKYILTCSGAGGTASDSVEAGTILQPSISTSDINNGLELYFDFEDVSNNLVIDKSIRQRNGIIYGDNNITSGKFGKSFLFNGNNYIKVSSFNIPSSITISAWVNLRNFGSGNDEDNIIRKGDSYGDTKESWLLNIKDRKIFFVPKDSQAYSPCSSQSNNCVLGDTLLKENEWYHIAGVYDGSNIKIYINGVLEKTKSSIQGIAQSNKDIYIGGKPSLSSDMLEGFIDELRIYNRALSDREILNLYNFDNSSQLNLITDSPVCPEESVVLSSNNIFVGETINVYAPSGWKDGKFVSSNTLVVDVSENRIVGKMNGFTEIIGIGWNAPNGARGCILRPVNLVVSQSDSSIMNNLSNIDSNFNIYSDNVNIGVDMGVSSGYASERAVNQNNIVFPDNIGQSNKNINSSIFISNINFALEKLNNIILLSSSLDNKNRIIILSEIRKILVIILDILNKLRIN